MLPGKKIYDVAKLGNDDDVARQAAC